MINMKSKNNPDEVVAVNYLIHRKISVSGVSELDFVLYEELFPGWDIHHHPNCLIEKNEKGIWPNDGNPIKIDNLITILQELKNGGCNYVEIEDNCDSIGYSIVGSEIRVMTSDEVSAYKNEKLAKKEAKKQKIKDAELAQLQASKEKYTGN